MRFHCAIIEWHTPPLVRLFLSDIGPRSYCHRKRLRLATSLSSGSAGLRR